MKKTIFTLTALFLGAFSVIAQDEYRSALDIATEGARLYSNAEYEEAFEEFSKVNYNDTAYWQLTLAALESAVEIDRVDTLLEVTTKVLEDKRYNPLKEKFVVMKGYALLQKDEFEETIKFYDGYLDEFPMSSNIHYNRGVAFYSLERYDEAIESIQTSIRYNPRSSSAHTKLGLICAEAQDYTKAALCLNMALFLAAGEEKAVILLSALEEIYTLDIEKNIGKVKYREDEDFSEINELIKNKIAENKNYKIKVKLPFNLFKYNHMVFDQMEYDENSNGFWNQNYVRFFKEVMKTGDFPYLCYFQCIQVDQPKVQKTIAKNTPRIKSFVTKAGTNFSNFMNDRKIWNGSEYEANTLQHYGRYGFNSSVMIKNGVQTGPYVGYTQNGLVDAEGTISSAGKQTGLWKFYNEDGVLIITSEFKDGELDGMRTTYYGNGSREQRFNVKDGEIDGNLEVYTAFNKILRTIPYSDGKENGTLKGYYNTGELYIERNFKDGEIEGESIQYFANGDQRVKEFYKAGKETGEYREFYRGGLKRTIGQFEEGEPVGHWQYFYKNGQLREEGDFKNGNRIGVWKQFSKDGKISEESNYGETGKKVGVYKEYDLDENLILELTYKGEEINSYKTYDDKGNVISEGEKKRKELEFENYYTNGQLRAKGNYYKGNRVGVWKFYNQYGVLESEEPYNEEGLLDGNVLHYFDNGELETSSRYKDGERDGLFEDFFRNGALYKTGYIQEGQTVGEWKYYYRNGTLSSTEYYLDGEIVGQSVSYDKKGRVNEIRRWFEGVLQSIEQIDSTGATLYEMVLVDGKFENAKFVNAGGKQIQNKNFDGARVNGEITYFYGGSGKVSSKGMVIDGSNHGPWVWYHENGQIETTGNFNFDSKEGEWKWFYENGQLDVVLSYVDGNAEGKRLSYYEDGTLRSETYYRNDEFHGECTYYDQAGEVRNIRYYKDGRMLGYSYLGSDGKPVPMIPFDNQNGLMEATFKNGKKSYYVEYSNGFKQGKSILYHANGKEEDVRIYEKGQLNGERMKYYPSGKIKVSENFYFGDRHGKCVKYYENGNIKSVENYILGSLYDKAIYYNSDGTVDREVQYYHGSQIK